MEPGGAFVTRAVVFTLDVSPAQDRMLRNYCGAARFGFNWALDQVISNMRTRAAETERGVPVDEQTSALSWSKDRHVRAKMHQLVWLHTVESTRRLYRLVETERASIQKVTIAYSGGRWQASFLVRYQLVTRPQKRGHAHIGGAVGVDLGVAHLATLSRLVPGVTDAHGHVSNPRPLAEQLEKLKGLDRRIARCQDGSNNRAKLVRRRARLHGRITKTRTVAHHQLANELAARFDLVGVEDLNINGMTHNRPLARALADAGLGRLAEIISTECADRGTPVVKVGRFYPSSKTCSCCGTVTAKLSLSQRTFDCTHCGIHVDRDVNAAANIEREAIRLHAQQQTDLVSGVAGLRPETRNADRRTHKTSPTVVGEAVFVDGRTRQPQPGGVRPGRADGNVDQYGQ